MTEISDKITPEGIKVLMKAMQSAFTFNGDENILREQLERKGLVEPVSILKSHPKYYRISDKGRKYVGHIVSYANRISI